MGSSSSCSKTKRIHRANQTSPIQTEIPSVRRRSSSIPSKSHDPLFVRTPQLPKRRPISLHDDIFEIETNVEDYSQIWDQDAQLSSTFQSKSKSSSTKLEHHQNETLNKTSSKKSAITFDSARVESTIDSETHSSINLSSSDKITELISNLNQIHNQLDDITKRRTSRISTETENVLFHILNETQEKQQRLLTYAKERQSEQNEIYQNLLQNYITQLDEMKAKELADLQKQLENYREEILEESHLKIMTVNDQANVIKTKILHEEQQQASTRMGSLVSQIQKLSTEDKVHQLGSEIKTATNIITNATVGTKSISHTSNERSISYAKAEIRSIKNSSTVQKNQQKE
ncbi:hypothetical protein I4U23_026879 [Adineta vaga]|nr:hypothetical protein I4U23_026879 [Adineta vaga]